MNVTHDQLWTAYKAARKRRDDLAQRAGMALQYCAFSPSVLPHAVGDLLVDVRAADLEAEQIYREYDAMYDAERAA